MRRGEDARFLFVESNTTGTGAVAVRRLLAAGLPVTFLARRPERYPFLTGDPAGLEVVRVETNDVERVATAVGDVVERTPVAALLTFSEYYVAIVAEVAQRHGFPFLSAAAARVCRDKHALRRTLAAAGCRNPPFRLVRDEEEAVRAGAEIGYPCVVKPPDDSSSQGVRRVSSQEELRAAVPPLLARDRNDRGQATAGAVLVEGYLDGDEVSLETVTLPGGGTEVVAVTAKHLSPPPLFVELGHDLPAALPAAQLAAAQREAEAALAAVGYDFGPAHLEMRLTAGGPVTVEINPRLPGGMIPVLVEHALGIDLLTAYLEMLQGRPVDLRPRHRRHASIRFLTAPAAGRLAAVEGVEEARRLETVREVAVTRDLGAAVRPAENALDRLGHVITAGDDRRRVQDEADLARRGIRVRVDQG